MFACFKLINVSLTIKKNKQQIKIKFEKKRVITTAVNSK